MRNIYFYFCNENHVISNIKMKIKNYSKKKSIGCGNPQKKKKFKQKLHSNTPQQNQMDWLEANLLLALFVGFKNMVKRFMTFIWIIETSNDYYDPKLVQHLKE